jgi:hypothetical protein
MSHLPRLDTFSRCFAIFSPCVTHFQHKGKELVNDNIAFYFPAVWASQLRLLSKVPYGVLRKTPVTLLRFTFVCRRRPTIGLGFGMPISSSRLTARGRQDETNEGLHKYIGAGLAAFLENTDCLTKQV